MQGLGGVLPALNLPPAMRPVASACCARFRRSWSSACRPIPS